MATPKEFFTKNLKWITLAFIFLFLLKNVQSCNRGMKLNISSGEYIHMIDSLQREHNVYYKESQDSIKKLNFELQLAKEQVKSANQQVKAVQSAVEKIRTNTTTTVVVQGANEIKDTINIK